MDMAIPILCYHRVHRDDENLPTPPAGDYCGHTMAGEFRRQMEFLANSGFTVVSHDALYAWVKGQIDLAPRSVVINFDDNRRNVLENAYPIMSSLGFTATIFTITGLADGDCPAMMNYPWLGWDELAQLQRAGWIIGAHTRNHLQLGEQKYSTSVIREEIERSLQDIGHHLGVKPRHFAYPVSSWNEKVEEQVKELFDSGRHWLPAAPWTYNQRGGNPYRLSAINVSAQLPFEAFRAAVDPRP